MKIIKRKICAITGSDDLEELHTFANYPLFMGCTDQPFEKDLSFDMEWVISKSSGTIQLAKLIPLEVLYSEIHNSVIGNIWKKHHKDFADFIKKFEPKIGVLEIGGAHGYLSKIYQNDIKIPWTIIEPNPSPIDGCNANFIKGNFSLALIKDINFDLIVHSHVLEHIYDPNEFFKLLFKVIKNKGKVIFSIPNMSVMLEKKYTNCINFEHTIFLTENHIDFLINKYGFKIIEKKYFLDDHSIFYCLEISKDKKKVESYLHDYKRNIKVFNQYISYYKKLIKNINQKLDSLSNEYKVYLFGAHIFSQHFIVNGLKLKNIINIIDNDPMKQGKRLYGTNLNVISPQLLKEDFKPHIIIKAGVYTDEIKKDIIENINSNAVFIE